MDVWLGPVGEARAMLRSVLGTSEIIREKSGRPRVEGGPDFNLSHSGDLAALAVSWDRRVGVDVEQHRELDHLGMAARVLRPSEHAAIAALPADRQAEAFFRYWTVKEAYVKVTGQGLSGLPGPEYVSNSLIVDGELWSVAELVLPQGYSGAVVSPGPPFAVTLRTW
ncbi:4'-phosphopantetheinyl transferase superfamily protein [Allokutzneria sp. A3M-2-11 16]|uniref:4'-phosphopantetheinyl transferase family protein n=1 Tax=Allokutzneria sp. A3M-2-11 16 TaxID=2962043 RepID=UPI0020B6A89A|nr:4'-phosphopantetheinyl transferase superfamily protein [Allokutzneria sp. A3M-2-11 16]MCP3804701.1 4'-phosphopantetheinyl transferase superfamily protein [Allokutzneria sp. A3M-2-11 16]